MSKRIFTSETRSHPATSYNKAAEMILGYQYLAEGQEDEPVYVHVREALMGGFEVTSGTYKGEDGQLYALYGIYVLPSVAKRLIDANLAEYCGYEDTFEDACARLEDNAKPHGEDYILAYTRWTKVISYEEAVALLADFAECAKENGDVAGTFVARVGGGAEMVTFASRGEESRGLISDSDYVSLATAQRLILEGRVDANVPCSGSEPMTEEEYKAGRMSEFGV